MRRKQTHSLALSFSLPLFDQLIIPINRSAASHTVMSHHTSPMSPLTPPLPHLFWIFVLTPTQLSVHSIHSHSLPSTPLHSFYSFGHNQLLLCLLPVRPSACLPVCLLSTDLFPLSSWCRAAVIVLNPKQSFPHKDQTRQHQLSPPFLRQILLFCQQMTNRYGPLPY